MYRIRQHVGAVDIPPNIQYEVVRFMWRLDALWFYAPGNVASEADYGRNETGTFKWCDSS